MCYSVDKLVLFEVLLNCSVCGTRLSDGPWTIMLKSRNDSKVWANPKV
jgi:hypothetical protein